MKEEAFQEGGVRGFLHEPESGGSRAIVLAHGAGSNCNAPILVSACRYFCEAGYLCLRVDLPFRQERHSGSPFPSIAGKDREGLREAAQAVRTLGASFVILGGHSYGGRQATMLAAEDASVANLLLLFSYPLHPPSQPEKLRTAHLPQLRVPAVFVHGTRDPFGTIDEMRAAVALIPAPTQLLETTGAHDLRRPPFPEILTALSAMQG
jgi:predicted alpha/beta-hydrolase family hydrolase